MYCDMTTDNNTGYTMVRFNDSSLGSSQAAYFNLCASHGMQLIVPRTKDHAFAIRDWNNGLPPNLVNIYPRYNGAQGLENWVAYCAGHVECSKWLSDYTYNGHINVNCAGFEPNGDNDTSHVIYRYTDTDL